MFFCTGEGGGAKQEEDEYEKFLHCSDITAAVRKAGCGVQSVFKTRFFSIFMISLAECGLQNPRLAVRPYDLKSVGPILRMQNLTEGILRLRYRNSQEKPELANPGEVYHITLDLWATSNVFLPGHRRQFEVSSSNFRDSTAT